MYAVEPETATALTSPSGTHAANGSVIGAATAAGVAIAAVSATASAVVVRPAIGGPASHEAAIAATRLWLGIGSGSARHGSGASGCRAQLPFDYVLLGECRGRGAALARLVSSRVAAAWNRVTSPYGRAINMAPSRPLTSICADSLADPSRCSAPSSRPCSSTSVS